MVKDMNYKADDTDCVLLLLCKMKPFVWNMQKAIGGKIGGDGGQQQADDVNQKESDDRLNVFFKFVPSTEDFINNGMECEENYKTCKLF